MRASARMLGLAMLSAGMGGAMPSSAFSVDRSFKGTPMALPEPNYTGGAGSYRRKDRHKNAAQVKRASIKARNRARSKGRA